MPTLPHSPVSSSSTTPISRALRPLADLGADVRRVRHADDDGSPADRFRNAGSGRSAQTSST